MNVSHYTKSYELYIQVLFLYFSGISLQISFLMRSNLKLYAPFVERNDTLLQLIELIILSRILFSINEITP